MTWPQRGFPGYVRLVRLSGDFSAKDGTYGKFSRLLDLLHSGVVLGANWQYLLLDRDYTGPLRIHWCVESVGRLMQSL